MLSHSPDTKFFQDAWKLPSNPFPFLGADSYRDEDILSLFEIDREKTIKAFSLQNSIIEGAFGTGKTMLLKAIYAFYYSKMIVDIAEKGKASVIPVYVKFSDLPYGTEDIYRALILYIYKKILDTRGMISSFLVDTGWFPQYKLWLQRLTTSGIFSLDKRYEELSADAVRKQVKSVFTTEGSVGFKWLTKLGQTYEGEYQKEILVKHKPGILDLEKLFTDSFKDICDRILLLVDEVDRLPELSFVKKDSQYSIYETIFNQFRTSHFLFYKVAVYPGTESSNQVEGSRIGTRIKLGFDIKDEHDFAEARDFFSRLLKSYLCFCAKDVNIDPTKFFHLDFLHEPQGYAKRVKKVDNARYGDALEQLIFGSKGIVRRFVQLAGDGMFEAAQKNRETLIVTKYDIFDAMRSFGKELIERLQEHERAVIDRISYFCMQNEVFRVRAPGHEVMIYDLYDKTNQDNVIYPILDQARRGLTYIFEFDYCYCVYRNIPTHFFLNAERVNKSRSLINGKWIIRPEDVPEDVIEGRMQGKIKKYNSIRGWGFIYYLPNKDLFFHKINVISENKELKEGARVSFRLGKNYEGDCAVDIEVLGK